MVTAFLRRRSVLSVLLLLFGVGGVRLTGAPSQDALDAVRARFAPDRRLAVFDVVVERQADAVVVSGEVESAAAREAALDAVRAGVAHVVDRIRILPAPGLGSDTQGIVRVSVANVKGKPSHAAEMVTQTLMGWPVRVLKEEGGWYLVHTEPEGYLGWIEDLQIARMTDAERTAWETAPLVVTIATGATVRSKPAPEADPVSDLVVGAVVRSVTTADGWTRVLLPDDRSGYVEAAAVEDYARWKSTRRLRAEAVEQTARRFMGVPYLWGGTSSKGFDCSGFAKTVFHLNGIDLPRDADQQAQAGDAVPLDDTLSQLRPGDLLFFGAHATADAPERISHVGIHIGHLEFIHASGLVRQNSLDPASPLFSKSLRARLLRARRVLPARPTT